MHDACHVHTHQAVTTLLEVAVITIAVKNKQNLLHHQAMQLRAPLAGLRLWLKRLRLWLWQNNGFFGEAEAIL
jgi:hypothetical protein